MDQIQNLSVVKANAEEVPVEKEMPEEKEDNTPMERLGPIGAKVHQPADYDEGFKLLKEYVDSIGGPPEKLRKKLLKNYKKFNK